MLTSHAASVRRLWALGLVVSTACAGAPPPLAPVVPITRSRPAPLALPAGDPYPGPALREEGLAEHRALVGPGADLELSLVLERGSCYALSISGARPVRASLADENEHVVAEGRGTSARLGEPALCPRWTGSFVLHVSSARELAEVAVRVARVQR